MGAISPEGGWVTELQGSNFKSYFTGKFQQGECHSNQ
jgi:hypothetical protein